MQEVLSAHEPLLVNTLGHTAGTLIFAIFAYLLFRDRAGARLRGSRLTMTAALLAFLWNFASLVVIAVGPSRALVALGSSALSLLPSVLLHLSLGRRFPAIRWAGYGLSATIVAVHFSEIWRDSAATHALALRLMTLGFAALTGVAILLLARQRERRTTSRLAAAMSLLLFSATFAHLQHGEPHPWPIELIAHHAGVALALLVLLQDFRFLLLDAFLRVLANILFTVGFVFALFSAFDARTLLDWGASNTFRQGVLIVGVCLAFLVFAAVRRRIEQLLTRVLFPRRDLQRTSSELRAAAISAPDEQSFIASAETILSELFHAKVIQAPPPSRAPNLPSPVADLAQADRETMEALGVEAIVPLRLGTNGTGDRNYILLGRRSGGRRYLSKDFDTMARVQAEMVEQIERFRENEMRRLVSQAELRALQSQIHPHFLFNALNTLYGVIPKEAEGARRTVLNLADIFRYFLRTDRTFIPLEEELEIVRAYLEIESLRLGSKLRTELEVEPEALRWKIPVLTIEPLVENAVKHGVASRAEGGTVRLTARIREDALMIEVADTGSGFQAGRKLGSGVGLDNVAKRLQLCYGPAASLQIESNSAGTAVRFSVPAPELIGAAR